MSLVQYTISNNSSVGKTFTYNSASITYNILVPGFTSSIFLGDNTPPPTLLITGSMVSEDTFVSDAYIPPSGSAWLWNNGNKVQYIKISDTPRTGSNIDTVIKKAEWIEFSMVGAKNKDGNFLYPTSPNSAQIERYVIDNTNDEGTYNSIVINDASSETSTAVFANIEDVETGFSYIDQQFSVNQDCDPLLNNATEPRINEWLQDVDYSVNAITPINFNQLIDFTATKASVPQSNYTQLGFVNSRYAGSSTTRTQINEYNPSSTIDIENKFVYNDEAPSSLINKGKGSSLGKIPNVELNNAYIAYFDRVIDPYPELNNKVAYYVKYLIDESGNILDPNLSDINFSIFKDTFQLKDYDNSPTRVNTAVSSIEEGKELAKLTDGLHSVFKVGAYPVPILYTQTSSIGYTDEISLSGSNFYSALGLGKNFIKLGIDIYSTQSSAIPAANRTQSQDLSAVQELEWLPANITPFDSNIPPPPATTTFPTSSIYPTYVILFPINDANSPQGEGAGKILSDNYVVKGSFIFTTSTIPAEYAGRDSRNAYLKDYLDRKPYRKTQTIQTNLVPYRKPPSSNDNIGSYVINSEGFNIKEVKLLITSDPGGINENIYPALTIEQKPQGYDNQWLLSPTGFTLTPDSLYIEDLIIQKLLNKNNVNNTDDRMDALPLIAGGWATSGGEVYGYGEKAIKYDWVIEFEFNNIVQGTGLFLKADSSILVSQSGAKHGFPFGQRPDDVFLFFGAGGDAENNLQWKRTFTPTYATGIATKPILKYSVTSPLSENVVRNKAKGPFWRRYPITFFTPPTCECYFISAQQDPLFPTFGVTFFYVNCNGDFDSIYLDPSTSDYICSSVLPTAFPSDRAIITPEPDGTLCGGCGDIPPPPTLTADQLYMSSSILNQTYSSSFIQARLPYNGDVSTDFPLTIEPSFIEFDPVTDFWEVQVGDEIRFENNENLTFTVSSILVNPNLDKNVNSDLLENKLRVVVTPPFEYTGSDGNIIVNQPSNFDFFVVRRYKENRNFIILDQQMPYGITSTGKGEIAFSGEDGFVGIEPVNPSSSPGLLLPQFRVDKFNVNPDLILKDLIEKDIVS
jgi:hypothetical protein